VLRASFISLVDSVVAVAKLCIFIFYMIRRFYIICCVKRLAVTIIASDEASDGRPAFTVAATTTATSAEFLFFELERLDCHRVEVMLLFDLF